MNIKVVAACAIVVGGLAAWYARSTGADHRGVAPTLVVPAVPIDARGTVLANEVARLGRRQQPLASPQHVRDPFHFAVPASRQSGTVPAVLPVLLGAGDAPAPPPRPAFRLIGVAEDSATGHLVRTAIIAAPDQLYVVREGEQLASRYGVARISPDVVELVDTGDSTALRLALK